MRFLNQPFRLSAALFLFLFPIPVLPPRVPLPVLLLLLLLRSALRQFVRLDLAGIQQLGRRRSETFKITSIVNEAAKRSNRI